MVEALRLWEGMDARLGRPTGYRRCGIVFACADEATVAKHEGWREHARRATRSSTAMLTPASVRARWCRAGASTLKGALLHARRRPRRAAEGGARHRQRGAAARRARPHRLRGARRRDHGRARRRRRHRARAASPAPRWCSRAAPGRASSAARSAIDLPQLEGDELGAAHRAARGRAGDRRSRPRTSPCASARTAATPSPPGDAQRRRHRARHLPAMRGPSCRRCGRSGASCASGSAGRFVDECAGPRTLGDRTSRRRSSGCACSTRRRRRARPSACSQSSGATSRSSADARSPQRWAGFIDVTPDAVPVISPVAHMPGFLHRHRLLRPRLRHRPGGRAAHGRPGHRRHAAGRSRRLPLRALRRRDTHGDPRRLLAAPRGSGLASRGEVAHLRGDIFRGGASHEQADPSARHRGHAPHPGRHLPHGLGPPLSRGGAGASRARRGLRDGRDRGDQPPVRGLRRRRPAIVTVAERPLDPALYPGAAPHELLPGGARLPHDGGAGRYPRLPQLVGLGLRRLLAAPRGARAARSRAARTIRWSRSPTRTPRPTPPGRARRCPPRPSGSSPPAAGSTARDFAWGDELAPRGRHVANTWQGAFPWQNLAEDGHAGTCPVRSFPRERLRPLRGLRQRLGMDHRLVRRAASRRRTRTSPCCCAADNPRGPGDGGRATTRPSPASPIPRRVIKGGSFLCAPNYCRRYRPAARHAQMVDTGTSHIGFRCIRR